MQSIENNHVIIFSLKIKVCVTLMISPDDSQVAIQMKKDGDICYNKFSFQIYFIEINICLLMKTKHLGKREKRQV